MEYRSTSSSSGSGATSPVPWVPWRLLLCLLLPTLLLSWGASSRTQAALDRHLEHLQTGMDLRLDQLVPFVDEGYDLHRKLSALCDRAEAAPDPFIRLKHELPRFNQRYHQAFRFFVWDASGEVVKELTDQAGYRYVLRQLWETLHEVARSHLSAVPQPPLSLEIVQRNSTLLRSFIGPFLAMNHLTRPLTTGQLHPVPLAHAQPDHSRFWYRLGRRFSVFCLIGQEPFRRPRSLRATIQSHNGSRQPLFQLGLFHEIDRRLEVPGGVVSHRSEVKLGLQALQKRLSGRQFTGRLYLTWRNLDVGLWGVAIADVDPFLRRSRADKAWWAALGVVFGFLAWASLTLSEWRGSGASVRHRIITLFLAANGLPLLTLGIWSADYLQQKEKALINEAFIEGEKALRTFDSSLHLFLQSLERTSNRLLSPFTETFSVPLEPQTLQDLHQVFARVGGDQLYILASGTGDLIDRVGISNDDRLRAIETMGIAYAYAALLIANHGSRLPPLPPVSQRGI
ncbi:MAG TPA: hypothetical protein PKO06_03745, partial [Candidatus Ozemobacteraceae bacterium]|nr:hypothetical protein [Candidatus Ozemobacteraceae bacterium]